MNSNTDRQPPRENALRLVKQAVLDLILDQEYSTAYGPDQPCLFLISISHISLSGGTRRYLPGFIPPPERALATMRSHNVRNSGFARGRRSHKERASINLAWD